MTSARTRGRRPAWRGIWAALPLLLTLTACHGNPVPREMIGTWVTDDHRYQGCSMQIAGDHITFGSPEKDPEICLIQKVSSRTKNGVREVTIDYVNSEQIRFTVVWIYSAENGGSLRFKNQPTVVWTPQERTTGNASNMMNVAFLAQGGE